MGRRRRHGSRDGEEESVVMGEKITGESYKGPAGILKDSDWLTSEAIPTDRDTVVEVEDVQRFRNLKLNGGARNETKKSAGALKFKGKDRMLLLNATNLKVMCALFGSNTAAWFGKAIALHVEKVSAFGQTVDAVRIRPDRNVKLPAPAKNGSDRPDVEWDGPKESKSD